MRLNWGFRLGRGMRIRPYMSIGWSASTKKRRTADKKTHLVYHCSHCGALSKQGARYCNKCGARFDNTINAW